MKKPETVTDDKGNIYIIPGQMTREEAEVYFPNQPERSKREDVIETTDKCVAMASMYRAMPNFNYVVDNDAVL